MRSDTHVRSMHLGPTDLEGLCCEVGGVYNELASICKPHSGNCSVDLQPWVAAMASSLPPEIKLN